MNKISYFVIFLTFLSGILPCKAQFYTISNDSAVSVVVRDQYYEMLEDSTHQMSGFPERVGDYDRKSAMAAFPETSGLEVSLEKDIPVFVNITDSLLSDLIEKRMNVCLPLDFIQVSSKYGLRRDPVYACRRFHNGIDLKCHYQYVYSMLPGIVKEVRYGNKGYGNYLILQHGNLECLYGHLYSISVHEGDVIQAGTIVAISGNTGKSTGPHLHIRLRKNGKNVDPENLVVYLNDYINRLQDKMAYLKFGTRPDMKLSISNLFVILEKYHVKFPKIVAAQALLETGYFSSRVCLENHNLFGLRKPGNGQYYSFDTWEESVKAYRDYVQYKYNGGDYYEFLDRIGYAENPDYTTIVRQIAKSL